jgi:hypothetical protein
MHNPVARLLGWATPLFPTFDPATLAVRLGHEKKACLMRQQGRCPGRDRCHDCSWAEGVSRPNGSR